MARLEIRFLLALLMALILTIVPMPNALSFFRPPWVALLLLYLQFFLPAYFSLTLTMVLGVSLDVLLSTLLGEHLFALVLMTWFASTRVRRFPMFSFAQQGVWITILCFLYLLILYLLDAYQGFNNTWFMVMITTFVCALIWPWMRLLLSHFFRLDLKTHMQWG